MSHGLLSIAVHLYGAAALVYLGYLVRQSPLLPWVGRALVGSGLALHVFSLGISLAGQGGLPSGLAQGFSTTALLLLAIFFALDLRTRLPVMGAFLLPIALAVLVPGLLISRPGAPLPPALRAPLLPLHVSIALLGIAAFGAASGVAVMYLLLERQLKAKKFGVLFARLPPLGLLDELNRRLLIWGFIALSVTMVTGTLFVSDARFAWRWSPKELATLVAWLGSGALLHARFFAGWQGKRPAVFTMAGFVVLLFSFFTAFAPGWMGG